MAIRKSHFILILILVLTLGINFYFMSQNEQQIIFIPGKETDAVKIEVPVANRPNLIEISTKCSSDSDCSWQITNCCTENAGGNWKCISSESQIECNELVLCPQVLSPRPGISCLCTQGSCVAK